jgi:hypothetical protein
MNYFKFYFVKGVDRRYPKRWHLSASPQTCVVQYFPIGDTRAVKKHIESLGFKPSKTYQTYGRGNCDRTLFIVFKNKADEASFIMHTHDGIEV